MSEVKKVYQAIVNVTKALGKEGISKDRKNAQQGYSFRGIDDVYNALSHALSENGLCIIPVVLERVSEERATKSGGTLFYVTVKMQFDLVSSADGSSHSVVTFGEAMDSGDKATNKAMSAAYKYAAMQTFCIPTEGDNDADAHTHEPAAKRLEAQKPMTAEQVANATGGTVVKTNTVSASDAASTPQLNAIGAILTKLGIKDDLARHEKVSSVLGLQEVVSSMKVLSKAQASEVIKVLGAEQGK